MAITQQFIRRECHWKINSPMTNALFAEPRFVNAKAHCFAFVQMAGIVFIVCSGTKCWRFASLHFAMITSYRKNGRGRWLAKHLQIISSEEQITLEFHISFFLFWKKCIFPVVNGRDRTFDSWKGKCAFQANNAKKRAVINNDVGVD